ncbi:MAG: type III pantothenate kinase [Planifilum fulgidum]
MNTLLVIDAGNTHIKWGIYEGPTLRFHWRIPTSRTHSELKAALRRLLEHHPLHHQLEGAVISSVVPAVTPLLIDLCRRSLDCDPLVAGSDIETGVSFRFHPVKLGSDRIVNVAAGVKLYGFPLIVVDLGTATTLDVVDGEGRFAGGVILPGIQTAAEPSSAAPPCPASPSNARKASSEKAPSRDCGREQSTERRGRSTDSSGISAGNPPTLSGWWRREGSPL